LLTQRWRLRELAPYVLKCGPWEIVVVVMRRAWSRTTGAL